MTGFAGKMPYEKKRAWAGFLFILPWVIGITFFFLKPLLKSLIYSLSRVRITTEGIVTTWIGFENYMKVFVEDPNFVRYLFNSVTTMVCQVPVIVIYSLLVACILNQKFKGRGMVRAIFFLPVIISSGIIINILNGDAMSQTILSGERASSLFQASMLQKVLLESGMPYDWVTFFMDMISRIFELSWKSGLQILLFIAGLQTIPGHLYEAAYMEGATSWEAFWVITFPMVTPIMIVNLVYSVIDGFTDYSNEVMKYILDAGKRLEFAQSSTLSWIYFAAVFVIVGIAYLLINRRVFYMEG